MASRRVATHVWNAARDLCQFDCVTSVSEHGFKGVEEQSILWLEQEVVSQHAQQRLAWMAEFVLQPPEVMLAATNLFGQLSLRDSVLLSDAAQITGELMPRDDLAHSASLLALCLRQCASGQFSTCPSKAMLGSALRLDMVYDSKATVTEELARVKSEEHIQQKVA